MISFIRAVWAIYKKDLTVWAHNPIIVVTSFVPTLFILVLIAAQAAAVGGSPVALVTLDPGPKGAQM
jgi:hypothetical protein